MNACRQVLGWQRGLVMIYLRLGLDHGSPLSVCNKFIYEAVTQGTSDGELVFLMKTLCLMLSWQGLEMALKAVYPLLWDKTTSVLTFVNTLAALRLCPRLNANMIRAFQNRLQDTVPEGPALYKMKNWPLTQLWTQYTLDYGQHGGFERFLLSVGPSDEDPEFWRPVVFWKLLGALMQFAVFGTAM